MPWIQGESVHVLGKKEKITPIMHIAPAQTE